MARVAVVLHERLGRWSAQVRPRLADRPVRWCETRSSGDLSAVLTGLAAPVILIDLSRQLREGLSDLSLAAAICPDALILVLDPDSQEGVGPLARELGATHVLSGFVPPPEVADLVDRWIRLAGRAQDRGEWSRPLAANTPLGPEDWLEAALLTGDADGEAAADTGSSGRSSRANLEFKD
ncbi:MAG: hypothetical protein U0790_09730 [Isosphaeraceae bacterium]